MDVNDTYGSAARFDTGRALTEDELFRRAPSIFATEGHHTRSVRFRPIPTIEVVRALATEGVVVVGAKQALARHADRGPFTKHLLRLRKLDPDRKLTVGDTTLEFLLKNANDGSAAYDLMAGLFKIRCLNSLVVHESTIADVRVRHSGKVADKVIEGTDKVLTQAERALKAPQDWSQIELIPEEQQVFARAAHTLRFADREGSVKTPVNPARLLRPRRPEDSGRDLWSTFNVIQENAIKGGIQAVGQDARGRNRQVTTRPIAGIDQDLKLNKALWQVAEEMARIKTGRAKEAA